MRFAVLGRTRALHDSVIAAVEAGHEPALIGTSAAAPEYGVGPEDFAALAARFGCPFFDDVRINSESVLQLAASSGAEVALSMNWLTLIRAPMLSVFPRGIVNVHMGDLPRYRGNACPNWAILAGEPEVVLSMHRMVEELDAGPILLQRSFDLTGGASITDVYAFLESSLPSMSVELLNGLEAGLLRERPQDPAITPLRCHPRRPEDALLRWGRPAEALLRLVRASARPFAGAYCDFRDDADRIRRLTVWEAHVESPDGDVLAVPGQLVRTATGAWGAVCGDDRYLVLDQVEVDGVAVATRDAFVSTKLRLGLDPDVELARLSARLRELEERAAR